MHSRLNILPRRGIVPTVKYNDTSPLLAKIKAAADSIINSAEIPESVCNGAGIIASWPTVYGCGLLTGSRAGTASTTRSATIRTNRIGRRILPIVLSMIPLSIAHQGFIPFYYTTNYKLKHHTLRFNWLACSCFLWQSCLNWFWLTYLFA